MPPKPDLPIYLAKLGPKVLELTGELAGGWLRASFMAEAADQVIPHLRAGAERSGRSLADLDLQISATVDVGEDIDSLIAKYRSGVAFTLGAMGSAETNLYNAACTRAGWGDMAARAQSLWVSGDKAAAIAAVAEEFVLKANFVGTGAMVAARI